MTDQQDFQNWELDKLSDYIVDTHHVYARKASLEITDAGNQLKKELGEKYPQIVEIIQNFEVLSKDLEDHMAGEEKYLFPYIKKLLEAKREGNKMKKPGFGSLDVPLKQHYKDHDNADNLMNKIHELSNGYTLPDEAPDTLKAFYIHLKKFEEDLKQHIYVENEVLFGKSVELEKEVIE